MKSVWELEKEPQSYHLCLWKCSRALILLFTYDKPILLKYREIRLPPSSFQANIFYNLCLLQQSFYFCNLLPNLKLLMSLIEALLMLEYLSYQNILDIQRLAHQNQYINEYFSDILSLNPNLNNLFVTSSIFMKIDDYSPTIFSFNKPSL